MNFSSSRKPSELRKLTQRRVKYMTSLIEKAWLPKTLTRKAILNNSARMNRIWVVFFHLSLVSSEMLLP